MRCWRAPTRRRRSPSDFSGGEPFVNRALLHACVQYAQQQGARNALDVRFSVTTNGTLLRPGDIALIRAHRFAVTISIDGAARGAEPPAAGADGQSTGFTQAQAGGGAPSRRAGMGANRTRARRLRAMHFDLSRRSPTSLRSVFPKSALRRCDGQGPRRRVARTRLASLSRRIEAGFAKRACARPYRRDDPSEQSRNSAQADRARREFAVSVRRWRRLFFRGRDGRWYACHRAIGAREFEMGDSSDSTASAAAISSSAATSTPRRRAGPAGRVTCAPVPVTRKPARAPSLRATSFAAGSSSA